MLDNQLNKGDLDTSKARFYKDLLDATGSGDGILIGEGAGHHTNGEYKRAEGFGLPFVGIGEGADRRPVYSHGVKAFIYELEDRVPGGRNLRMVDQARFMDDALGLRAHAHLPCRARLVDTGGETGVEVTKCLGVLGGKTTSLGTVIIISVAVTLLPLSKCKGWPRGMALVGKMRVPVSGGEMGDWLLSFLKVKHIARSATLLQPKVIVTASGFATQGP